MDNFLKEKAIPFAEISNTQKRFSFKKLCI